MKLILVVLVAATTVGLDIEQDEKYQALKKLIIENSPDNAMEDQEFEKRYVGRDLIYHYYCLSMRRDGLCKNSLIKNKYCRRTCSCYDKLSKNSCSMLKRKGECEKATAVKYCYRKCHNCFLCHKFQPLGLQNGKIKNKQITASSMYSKSYPPWNARLHLKAPKGQGGGWSARHNKVGEWWQVDLRTVYKITAFAIQGRSDSSQWVTKYSLKYGLDGITFKNVENDKVFRGNHDRHEVQRLNFHTPIIARYFRVVVKGWYGHISMRAELYGCK